MKGVQLLVLPEWGLHGLPPELTSNLTSPDTADLQHRLYTAYTEQLPGCAGRTGCCFPARVSVRRVRVCEAAPGESLYERLHLRMACIARAYRIALLFNMGERLPASGRQYNTNVLFDARGCLQLRYRKRHLLNEFLFDVPDAPEDSDAHPVAVFESAELGRVAAVVCFDIESPRVTQELAARVDTLLLPVAWTDYGLLDPLLSYRYHAAIAARLGINLLVANLHNPENYMGSSGIYAPDGPRALHCSVNRSAESTLLVADVPLSPRLQRERRAAAKCTAHQQQSRLKHDNSAAAPKRANDKCVVVHEEYDRSAKSAQMQARYLEGSSLVYRFDPLEHHCVKACYAGLCCRVRIDLSPEPTASPAAGELLELEVAGDVVDNYGDMSPTDREHRYQWCRLSRADEVTHHDHKCALDCPTPTAHLPEHMPLVPELDLTAVPNTNLSLSAPNDTLDDLFADESALKVSNSSASANVTASRLSSRLSYISLSGNFSGFVFPSLLVADPRGRLLPHYRAVRVSLNHMRLQYRLEPDEAGRLAIHSASLFARLYEHDVHHVRSDRSARNGSRPLQRNHTSPLQYHQ